MYLYTFISILIKFKAFPLSKFNSETSFLYQLFKEDSNFRVKKPCKVIYLSAYDVFVFYIYLCIYIHLQMNILKPSWCLNSIPRQVFCINFSRRIQILLFQSHAMLFISLFLLFSLLFIFIHMFIYAFIHLHINILKPSRCLNSIPRQVFLINFSRGIQIS